ncbi:MAG TPA: sigma factor [Myxococcales bacterium]|jgi:RNA polymerase sigma-70 factor (ECF subfamily)
MADLDHHLPGIAAGDADAFGRWVAGAELQVRDSLRPFAASVDAEAVLQESLLRVWQTAPGFRPDGRPNALLRLAVRIARNLAVSEVRKRRTDSVDAEELERALARLECFVSAEGPDPHLRRLVEECRKRLPGKPSEALAQRLTSGGAEPDATLAERVNMRLNTFLQNVTRARKLMADCLKKKGVDLEAERS